MVKIARVGFLPQNNGHRCEVHPYGCGNALLERRGNGVERLVELRLVEGTNLADYMVGEDSSDGCRVCFVVQEYASGENTLQLNDSLLRITDVSLPDSENRNTRTLFHHNHGYAYAEIVEMNEN